MSSQVLRTEPVGVDLVSRLRAGDEAAFGSLVTSLRGEMVRVALRYVRSAAVAEEVVQDTWVNVARGLDRFEGRSSLKTWIYSILVNCALTSRARERRSMPMSVVKTEPAREAEEPSVLSHVVAAIDKLPPRQRRVIALRDVAGYSADEVCGELGITKENQRVLLHRARAAVRREIAPHLSDA